MSPKIHDVRYEPPQTETCVYKGSKVLVCHLEASYPGPHEVAANDGAGGAQQVHHARPGKV